MAAINSIMDPKENFVQQIMDSMEQEIVIAPNSTLTLGEIKRRLEELQDEFRNLLAVASDGNAESYSDRFRSIAEEMAQLKSQQEEISSRLRNNSQVKGCLDGSKMTLHHANHHVIAWNEEMIRQLVHTVKVLSAERIKVTLYDGTVIDWMVSK